MPIIQTQSNSIDPHFVAEASDLGWRPGTHLLTVEHEGKTFTYSHALVQNRTTVCWRYSCGAATLTVFND